jgi:hypothetical protein
MKRSIGLPVTIVPALSTVAVAFAAKGSTTTQFKASYRAPI